MTFHGDLLHAVLQVWGGCRATFTDCTCSGNFFGRNVWWSVWLLKKCSTIRQKLPLSQWSNPVAAVSQISHTQHGHV